MKNAKQRSNERQLLFAVGEWWKSKRPAVFSEDEHLKNLAVNTKTDAERKLAVAYANYIKAENKKG